MRRYDFKDSTIYSRTKQLGILRDERRNEERFDFVLALFSSHLPGALEIVGGGKGPLTGRLIVDDKLPHHLPLLKLSSSRSCSTNHTD